MATFVNKYVQKSAPTLHQIVTFNAVKSFKVAMIVFTSVTNHESFYLALEFTDNVVNSGAIGLLKLREKDGCS